MPTEPPTDKDGNPPLISFMIDSDGVPDFFGISSTGIGQCSDVNRTTPATILSSITIDATNGVYSDSNYSPANIAQGYGWDAALYDQVINNTSLTILPLGGKWTLVYGTRHESPH